MGDIANDAKCGTCSHLGSMHADTDEGENTGSCSAQGCDCSAMDAPGSSDGDGGDASAVSVTFSTVTAEKLAELVGDPLALSIADVAEALAPGDAEFAALLERAATAAEQSRITGLKQLAENGCFRTGCAHTQRQHLDLDVENGQGVGKCLADGCQCAAFLPTGAPGEPQLPEPPIVAAAEDGEPGEPGGPEEETDEEPDGFPYRALLVQEGVETSDGRFIEAYATRWRELPLSLAYQDKTEHGGMADTAAVNIGRIDAIVRAPGGTFDGAPRDDGSFDLIATGVLDDDDPAAVMAAHKIEEKFLRGVSIDMAVHAADVEITAVDEDGWPIGERLIVTECEIGMATVTSFPAFADCQIELTGTLPSEAETEFPGLELPEVGDRIPILAAGDSERESFTWHMAGPAHVEERENMTVVASGGPLAPPAEWFEQPEFSDADLVEIPPHLCSGRRNVKACPLTITDDGRVFGHLASWHVNHTAMSGRSMKAPKSAGYDLFNTRGTVRCDDGSDVPVGTITLDGGHADLRLDWRAAMAHYDDTRSAVIDCRVGADEHGVWLAGALRPDVDDLQLRRLRAASISGDWRPLGSRHELVAACSVNTPGFPTLRRALAASGAPDELVAMVAAGALPTRPLDAPSVEDLLARATDELGYLRREREAEKLLRTIG